MSRPVLTPSGQYPSASAAARAYGMPHGAVHRMATDRQGGFSFTDSLAEKSLVNTPAGIFATVADAARGNVVSERTVRRRITDPKMPDWSISVQGEKR